MFAVVRGGGAGTAKKEPASDNEGRFRVAGANELLDGVANVHIHGKGQLSGLDRDRGGRIRGNCTAATFAIKDRLVVNETDRLDLAQGQASRFRQGLGLRFRILDCIGTRLLEGGRLVGDVELYAVDGVGTSLHDRIEQVTQLVQ